MVLPRIACRAHRPLLVAAAAVSLLANGCADEAPVLQRPRAWTRPPQGAAGQRVAAPLPPQSDQDRLLSAHHLEWVSGDFAAARRMLQAVAADPAARGQARVLAALRLAESAEVSGDRRTALSHLDQAKNLAGSNHALALEADDRRARILTASPRADVRGPVPGTAQLKGESPAVLAGFRVAEQRLASFHRIVVAPRLENIGEVLRTKRHALAGALSAYQQVVGQGGVTARAAALFRMGAMYHHLAEALAFESPEELLPSAAHSLTRQLRADRAGYLRRALASYRSAAQLPAVPAAALWQQLARREVETLELVLKARGTRAAGP